MAFVYLTPQQILFMHARLVEETGGLHGVREIGMLESAAARPRATFSQQELYPDLFAKAAALMESLAKNHPFLDGNKRTAITAAGIFLQINGFRLEASSPELERFTLDVVNGKIDFSGIAAWLQEHVVRAGYFFQI